METTAAVQTLTDELLGEIEAAANDVRGWTMREYFQEPEEGFLPADWEWYVGSMDEDGNRYPLLNVNAHQYDSEDSEKLAKYYALVNRDHVLAMAAELRTLRAENAELRKDVSIGSWIIEYMASSRTDLDDELVVGCSEDNPHKLMEIIARLMGSKNDK